MQSQARLQDAARRTELSQVLIRYTEQTRKKQGNFPCLSIKYLPISVAAEFLHFLVDISDLFVILADLIHAVELLILF